MLLMMSLLTSPLAMIALSYLLLISLALYTTYAMDYFSAQIEGVIPNEVSTRALLKRQKRAELISSACLLLILALTGALLIIIPAL